VGVVWVFGGSSTVMVNRGWVDRETFDAANRKRTALPPLPTAPASALMMDGYLVEPSAPAPDRPFSFVGVTRPSEERSPYLDANYNPATDTQPMLYLDIPGTCTLSSLFPAPSHCNVLGLGDA
jgi:hypothetical protein